MKDYRQTAREWFGSNYFDFESIEDIARKYIRYDFVYEMHSLTESDIFRIWLLETTHSLEQAVDLVRNHGVAVKYDNGDFGQLKIFLNSVFPIDTDYVTGKYKYYFVIDGKYGDVSNTTDLPYFKLSSVVKNIAHEPLSETEYKGYIIAPNLTGYVNYDFYLPENDGKVEGHGKTIEDCKVQIDELVSDNICCDFKPYGHEEQICKKCGYVIWVSKSKTPQEILKEMISNGYPKPECIKSKPNEQ